MEEKLVELETRYSFQEDLLQKLNEIVTGQQQQLDRQSQQIQLLHQQLSALQQSVEEASDTGQQRPPHY